MPIFEKSLDDVILSAQHTPVDWKRTGIISGGAFTIGCLIGLRRGGKMASLQFRAENVHRPPHTYGGWYFYHKTKNYKVMLAAMRSAGRTGGLVGSFATTFVLTEQGINWAGKTLEDRRILPWSLSHISDVVACAHTTLLFSLFYRLPWRTMRRAVGAGLLAGVFMQCAEEWRRHMAASLAESEREAAERERREAAKAEAGITAAAATAQSAPSKS
ncbi:hypothetical protein FISHEDRAFT_58447 [Fistulina hepatica ATCC 64428]|nr:hypothetical protein FISHEDRAFT_58447 [Fistulina hepatica ATCC 64428]